LLFDIRNASMRFVGYLVCLYFFGIRPGYLGGDDADRPESLQDGRAVSQHELLPFWWQYL